MTQEELHWLKALEARVVKLEKWVDLWETYDSGWTEYRQGKDNV